MAPKTGCTSITKALSNSGYAHVDDAWHDCQPSREVLYGRRLVVTYRDPRDRILSIWGHTGNGRPLDEFVVSDVLNGDRPFRYRNLAAWYRDLSFDGVVRIDHLRPDMLRELKFPLIFEPHRNATEHPSWEEACQQYPQVPSLLKSWVSEDLQMFADWV